MVQSVIPAGLGETFGFSKEATVGTFVAPARWIPHKNATFLLKKTIAQSEALRGSRFLAGPRRVLVAHSVDGTIELEIQDKQFGLLLAACLGSTAQPVEDNAGPLWVQNHVPNFP